MKVDFTRQRKGELGYTFLEIDSKGTNQYYCSDCNKKLERIKPNPYVWTCTECENDFTGPIGEDN